MHFEHRLTSGPRAYRPQNLAARPHQHPKRPELREEADRAREAGEPQRSQDHQSTSTILLCFGAMRIAPSSFLPHAMVNPKHHKYSGISLQVSR